MMGGHDQLNKMFVPLAPESDHINLLVRDPHTLFVYWETADNKKENFIREFGENLWDKSVRVLKVTNVSNNTVGFIKINESATSWYVNVEDANSLYVVEVGRKISDQFFVCLGTSNYSATPGETMSPNTTTVFVDYNDLRNGKLDLKNLSIIKPYGSSTQIQGTIGLSSPELYRTNLSQAEMGISSAQIYGIDLDKQFGISAEGLMNRKGQSF
jgi:hypothetical protein